MTQINKTQFSFAGGIFSPSMYGRSDISRWESAVAEMENFVSRPEGSASRRSGTRFGDSALNESKKVALIPFIFSTEDAYILEMTEGITRVWTQEGTVQDTGVPILTTIATPPHDGKLFFDSTSKFSVSTQPVNIVNLSGTRTTDFNNPDAGPPVDVQDTDVFFIGDVTDTIVTLFRDSAFVTEATLFISVAEQNTQELKYSSGFSFANPYLEDELEDVRVAQSADVIYMVHENHPPQVVTRRAADDFRSEDFVFENGPWRDENSIEDANMEITTIVSDDLNTLGAVIRVTSNSIFEFDAGRDIGRPFRIFVNKGDPDGYVSITITSLITVLEIEGTIFGVLSDDTPPSTPFDETTRWSLGFEVEPTRTPTDTDMHEVVLAGFPRTITFHQQRLAFAGSPEFPENVWFSRVGRFDDFTEFEDDLEVNDDDAITVTLADNTVNAIRWMNSSRVLVIGTSGGLYNVDADRVGDSFTANSVRAVQVNSKPCAEVDSAVFESINAYVSLTKGKVRGSKYRFEDDSYRSDDLSIFSDSVLESGAEELTYADEPHSQLHVRLGSGTMGSLSFVGEQQVQGWNRVKLGGTFRGGPPFIESFTAIPSPPEIIHGINVQYSQVWIAVRRTIDGVDRRYIEFFENDFIDGGDLEDAFFVDSGLSAAKASGQFGVVSDITNANPGVITIPLSHGFSPGNLFKLSHVNGMPEVNDTVFTAGAVTSTTLEIAGVDTSNFGTYIDGGEARFMNNVVSGLDHLEGETVQIVGDGTVYADQVVVSGSLTIVPAAAEVHAGLAYVSTLEQLPLDQATFQGSGMGKIKRVTHADVRFKDTVGGKIGVLDGPQEALTDRLIGDILDKTTGLANGWVSVSIDSGYNTEGRVAVIQEEPMPMTVVAITRSGETTTR